MPLPDLSITSLCACFEFFPLPIGCNPLCPASTVQTGIVSWGSAVILKLAESLGGPVKTQMAGPHN